MSRGLGNPSSHRDYGATSSNVNAITSIPDVITGFSPTEFMTLSENIAHNITSVKSSWQQLEKALKVIDANRDTQATRDKVHHIQAQTNIKIQATSKDLQRLSTVVRRGDKQQKLQLEKLTGDFRSVVEKYSASQQVIAIKMKQIFLKNMHAQQQDEEAATAAENMSASDREELIQRQKEMQKNLQFEHGMLQDRETRIKEIEADILDVNDIMRDLSSIVNQQGEKIDAVENNVDQTCSDVEAGRDELLKAAEYRQRYRRKVLILLVIAVIVGLIITGIIVSQLKS